MASWRRSAGRPGLTLGAGPGGRAGTLTGVTDATPGPGHADDPDEDWVVLSRSATLARLGRVPSSRAVVGRMVAAAAVVSLIIGTIAFFVSNRLAEQDTLSEGVRITQILASEITPQLSEKLFAGDPAAIQVVDVGVLPALSRYGVRQAQALRRQRARFCTPTSIGSSARPSSSPTSRPSRSPQAGRRPRSPRRRAPRTSTRASRAG